MKLKAAIIGCGNIAGLNELDSFRQKPCTHLGAYRTRKDVEVVGCCDADINRAQSFAQEFGIDFYTDSAEKLLSKKIDVLSICVPYKYCIISRISYSAIRNCDIFMWASVY